VVEREKIDRTPYRNIGINYIGIVINHVGETKARLIGANYQENDLGADHPWRKRCFFSERKINAKNTSTTALTTAQHNA
jgi:hypothetical protein